MGSITCTDVPTRRLMPGHCVWLLPIRLPISIRCDTCGNHFCRGINLKFPKELVVGVSGIRRFRRLYFNCSKCSAKITLKAFPNNPNWVLESGATMIREEEAQENGGGIKSSRLDERDEDSEDDEDN